MEMGKCENKKCDFSILIPKIMDRGKDFHKKTPCRKIKN